MKSPYKKERKLVTDFYMWMVENGHDHNIRIRVETKAELFFRERDKANGVEQSDSNCNLNIVIKCPFCKGTHVIKTGDVDYNHFCQICERVFP